MSPDAGTHCSAGIDASDTRFFLRDSSELCAVCVKPVNLLKRSIFRSVKILAKKPYVPAHYFASDPTSSILRMV